jgi:hypothetical protein
LFSRGLNNNPLKLHGNTRLHEQLQNLLAKDFYDLPRKYYDMTNTSETLLIEFNWFLLQEAEEVLKKQNLESKSFN